MEQNIQDIVRALTEGIVLAEASELQLLAELHTKLEHVANWANEQSSQPVTAAANTAAELLQSIVLRDVADADAALRAVSQEISRLQGWIIEGMPLPELPQSHAPVTAATNAPANAGPTSAAADSGVAAPTHTASDHPSSAPASASSHEAARMTADPDLVADFISESREHLEATDSHLLTLEQQPGDQEALNAIFRAFHTIKGVAGFLDLMQIRDLAHEAETLLDKARKGQMSLTPVVLDVVFEAGDTMKRLVKQVELALSNGGLLSRDSLVPAVIAKVQAAAEGRISEAAPAGSTSAAPAPASAPAAPARPAREAATEQATEEHDDTAMGLSQASGRQSGSVRETVRVDAERLDKLVDAIGEMVIAEAMVGQNMGLQAETDENLPRLLNHLDKITRELQELAMSLRMVPVRSAFQRMARLARDVAKKLHKPIEFVTEGEETELDKNVVDAIVDPLVHMIRNAVDHGIETNVEDRRAAGKPDAGRIILRAYHKGGGIYIEIEDDGRGLNREAILHKARERKLIRENETPADSDLFNLIFEPGFSTAKVVTDMSGRGVGMDVVKRNIQALRGRIDIRSQEGRGTIFSIRLPLTLAIIEGMVVRVGRERFIFPTLSIVRMIRPEERSCHTVMQRNELLQVNGQLVPLHRLDRLFNMNGQTQDSSRSAVVVVEDNGKQYAFTVDELLGQQQIVIKPLGPMLKGVKGLSGGAVMPDGRVGLILDVSGLIFVTSGEGSLNPDASRTDDLKVA